MPCHACDCLLPPSQTWLVSALSSSATQVRSGAMSASWCEGMSIRLIICHALANSVLQMFPASARGCPSALLHTLAIQPPSAAAALALALTCPRCAPLQVLLLAWADELCTRQGGEAALWWLPLCLSRPNSIQALLACMPGFLYPLGPSRSA